MSGKRWSKHVMWRIHIFKSGDLKWDGKSAIFFQCNKITKYNLYTSLIKIVYDETNASIFS